MYLKQAIKDTVATTVEAHNESISDECLKAIIDNVVNVTVNQKPRQQFTFNNGGDDAGDTAAFISQGSPCGMTIGFSGYSDYYSDNDNGSPIFIERIDNDIRVVIHADINQEDPTHIIELAGAKIENRTE